jgi:sortase A
MLTIEPPKPHRKAVSPLDLHNHGDDPKTGDPTVSSGAASTQPQPQAIQSSKGFTLHLPEHKHQAGTSTSQARPEDTDRPNRETAADIIRGKIARLYKDEPSAQQEISAIEQASGGAYSKHQEFVMRLVNTGRPLSEIQEAWHSYYAGLPDHEKHEVWQEFYSSYERASKFAQALMARQANTTHQATPDSKDTQSVPEAHDNPLPHHAKHIDTPHSTGPTEQNRPYTLTKEQIAARKTSQLQTVGALKSQLLAKISSRTPASKSTHVKSLAFGLATGGVFILIILFSFFNERFITPFIMPGKATAATRLIIDPNQNADVGPESKIIIPKLNVEVPVVFDVESIEEKVIQQKLEDGVVHYPITEKPGELGNGAIVGHSSNNILNKGKYKFAFLMLKKLEAGDTFYIHYNSKRYVYKVYESKIVEATEVSVLEDTDRPATFTLITCDPPGTSAKRLIVRGEQISPEPAGNATSSAPESTEQPAIVPGNSESLWQRIF